MHCNEINYNNCKLCARLCGVDRDNGQLGYCKSGNETTVCRAEPHFWEEPIISGMHGSGAIFFGGCSLGCIFCQNREISNGGVGKIYSVDGLATLMLDLQKKGVHNVNLVTATHFVPSIISSVKIARAKGFMLPIVYNTGAYECVSTVKSLNNTVDVYLPDFKYYRKLTANKLSNAPDYPKVAKDAIAEMVRQKPKPVIENGLIKMGVVVRILLLPGAVAEAKLSLRYLYETYKNSIYISLMSQYTPMPGMTSPLNRKVTKEEYRQLVDYAERLGVTQAFIQDTDSAQVKYVPEFDLSPIVKKPSN